MGKVKGKHRLDKYYHLAKEHGYRSRASWKLAQLDSKYSFLRSSRSVLDLCAAPGGWMQVAVERVPVGSLVLGVDLVPIAPIRGAIAFQQDITKPECKARIKKIMSEKGCIAFDLVLHDGSPNVGGAWSQEAMTQNALVIDAVKLATQFLAPNGAFVTKVFRSQDYNSVRYCLKQLFEKVEVEKPAASRSASAEIYLLGLKYKAPAKIDPRLLDVKHLFEGSIEPPRMVVDVLRGTKQKRHRDGYEEGDMTLRKESSVVDFVWSDSPLEMLGSVTSMNFDDPACLLIKDHALTTMNIKCLCDDLRVLGERDFRDLLKWRINIRKALSSKEKDGSTPALDVENEDKEDEDDKILNEMEELTQATERKKKREKKVLAKRRAKEKARKATGMQLDVVADGYTDHDLFSLSTIKGKKDLVVVDSAENEQENAEVGEHENDEDEDAEEPLSSDVDSDEERRRYDEEVEDLLDKAYERYVTIKEGSTKQRKRAKEAYLEDAQLLEDRDDIIQSDEDSDRDQAAEDENPLMVSLNEGQEPTPDEITNKWFSQDIFAEAVKEGDLEKSDSDDDMQIDGASRKLEISKKDEVKAEQKQGKQDVLANGSKTQALNSENDFEIVPAPATDSSDNDSSSSDDSDDDDPYTKAEILACAKKMLRKRKRNEILDDSYNKYMFHDEGLPKWFLDEELKHRQPVKPVTKEEIAAMKAQFKEIDARPAKKVAQAKARKKRVAMRKLEKVRKKANVISDQADISDRSKSKMIDQLYKKATPKRPKKEYVVAKKGVQVKAGKGKVLVDRRMKKDMRAKRTSKADKGSKKGKNVKGSRGKGSSDKGPRGKGASDKGSRGKGASDKGSAKRGKSGYRSKKMAKHD